MKSDKFSFEQIVQYAATIEQRGVKLYTFAASKLKNEPARNILLHLAEQEKKHEAYFLKLKEEVHVSNYKYDQLDEQDAGYLSVLVKSEIFPADDNKFLSQIENMKDVIRVSKQSEKDSILFYIELAKHTWDESAASTIKSIIEEEKRHLVQLQELDKLIEERDVYY